MDVHGQSSEPGGGVCSRVEAVVWRKGSQPKGTSLVFGGHVAIFPSLKRQTRGVNLFCPSVAAGVV
jgi:hypothetical protein